MNRPTMECPCCHREVPLRKVQDPRYSYVYTYPGSHVRMVSKFASHFTIQFGEGALPDKASDLISWLEDRAVILECPGSGMLYDEVSERP